MLLGIDFFGTCANYSTTNTSNLNYNRCKSLVLFFLKISGKPVQHQNVHTFDK